MYRIPRYSFPWAIGLNRFNFPRAIQSNSPLSAMFKPFQSAQLHMGDRKIQSNCAGETVLGNTVHLKAFLRKRLNIFAKKFGTIYNFLNCFIGCSFGPLKSLSTKYFSFDYQIYCFFLISAYYLKYSFRK